jgi:hypothetical protein
MKTFEQIVEENTFVKDGSKMLKEALDVQDARVLILESCLKELLLIFNDGRPTMYKHILDRAEEVLNESLSPQEKQPEREITDWDEVEKKYDYFGTDVAKLFEWLKQNYTLPKQITEGKEEAIEFAECEHDYHTYFNKGYRKCNKCGFEKLI